MKLKILLVLGLLLIVLVVRGRSMVTAQTTVEVGDKSYEVEVASDGLARSRGLSGRESLGDGEGMLFVFDGLAEVGFWMKGMNFDIDMVWIESGKVVGVSEATYENKMKIYSPGVLIDMVLEVNVNSGISVGEGVEVVQY